MEAGPRPHRSRTPLLPDMGSQGRAPRFPYALHMLALMCPLTNGGRVSIFPTSPSPLVAFTMNCNYAQTRKSSMTSHSDQTMKPLDDLVRQRVQNQLAAGGHQAARLATKKRF